MYGILQQLLGGALGPAVSDIAQAVNSADPVNPLSPQELATLVARKFVDVGPAATEAAKSGLGPGRFDQLVQLASQPPSLGFIIAAYQRGIIGDGDAASHGLSLQAALADLGLEPQWADVIKQLTVSIPPTEAVMDAWLEGQIEEPEARTRYLAAGGDPTWFQSDYNRQGQAPTPVQALDMLNRGIIALDGTGPESTSYKQAFLEGPWRNKWEPAFEQLRYYLTPPRTITAQLREGSIDEALAIKWFTENGLDADTMAAYLRGASHTTTATQRELTKTEILGLYDNQLITTEQATTDLVAAKYTAADAALLLALEDKKRANAAVKTAVTRLQNLYLAGTNSVATTNAALHALGLNDQQVANLLTTWNLEQSAVTRTLSESQIVQAWHWQIFSADQATNLAVAVSRLQALGYSVADARILIGINAHAPLP